MGNSPDNLHQTRSVAYSEELVLLNKHREVELIWTATVRWTLRLRPRQGYWKCFGGWHIGHLSSACIPWKRSSSKTL